MSASIELSVVVEPICGPELESKRLFDLGQKCSSLRLVIGADRDEIDIHRRYTGSMVTSRLAFLEENIYLNKLKRWSHGPQQDSCTESRGETFEDFFHQTDVMSQNSFDCPAYKQSVENWLNHEENTNLKGTKMSPSSSNHSLKDTLIWPGGKTSDLLLNNWHSESCLAENLNHDRYQSLKEDFARLSDDYRKLRAQVTRANKKIEKISVLKQDDLESLKDLLIDQGNKLEHLSNIEPIDKLSDIRKEKFQQDLENEKLRNELAQLASELSINQFEYELQFQKIQVEMEKFGHIIECNDSEFENLVKLRDQLSLACGNEELSKLMGLRKENSNLKETNLKNSLGIQSLKQNCAELEPILRSLCNDQCHSQSEQNLALANLKIELGELQARIPRLESVLKIENEIKLDLQKNLEELTKENTELGGELTSLREKTRSICFKRSGFEELDKFRNEVQHWVEVCYSLERDKENLESQVKLSKSRINTLDQMFADNSVDSDRSELDEAKFALMRSKTEKEILAERISHLSDKLSKNEMEKLDLSKKKLELDNELQISEKHHKEEIKGILSSREESIEVLKEKLKLSDVESQKLKATIDELERQLEGLQNRHHELKRLFVGKQKESSREDEFRVEELSKLRDELKLERHKSQVLKHEIEQEARISLQELESMKWRFSKPLVVELHNCKYQTKTNECHRVAERAAATSENVTNTRAN